MLFSYFSGERPKKRGELLFAVTLARNENWAEEVKSNCWVATLPPSFFLQYDVERIISRGQLDALGPPFPMDSTIHPAFFSSPLLRCCFLFPSMDQNFPQSSGGADMESCRSHARAISDTQSGFAALYSRHTPSILLICINRTGATHCS